MVVAMVVMVLLLKEQQNQMEIKSQHTHCDARRLFCFSSSFGAECHYQGLFGTLFFPPFFFLVAIVNEKRRSEWAGLFLGEILR